MYTTRCDKGQVWDGSSCIGTRQTTTWNNGSQNWTTTGYTSFITGRTNTENLAILVDAGSPYKAAQYCADLIENGHNDWYLPAKDEFNQLWLNFGSGKTHTSVGNFDVSGQYYWSSSEYSNYTVYSWYQRLSDGYQTANWKNGAYLLRCVRRLCRFDRKWTQRLVPASKRRIQSVMAQFWKWKTHTSVGNFDVSGQ